LRKQAVFFVPTWNTDFNILYGFLKKYLL